eukprot:s3333_g3.t3
MKPRFKQSRWYNALNEMELLRRRSEPPNLIRHTMAMRSCAHSSLWRMATRIFFADAVRIWDLEPDIVSCGTIMGACKKNWQRSLRLVCWAEDHDLRISSTLLGQAVSACKETLLWRVAGEILNLASGRDVLPDLKTHTAMLGACADRWDRSLECMSEMEVLRLPVDQVSRNSAMNACARTGSWRRTLSMRGLDEEMDQSSLSTCQNAFAKSNLWEVPLTLLLSSCTLRAHPDVVAYGAVLSACERRWQRSVAVMRSMRLQGQVQPDLACFHTLMDGSAWELPLNLLLRLGDLRQRPGVTSYNIAINSCHDWRVSRALLQCGLSQMGLETNLIGYNSAMAKGGPWQAPLEIYQKVMELGLVPDAMSDASLANAWRQHQQWRRALSFGERSRSAGAALWQVGAQSSPWYVAASLFEPLSGLRVSGGHNMPAAADRWEQVLDVLRCATTDLESVAKALSSASPWQLVLEIFTASLQRRSLGSEELQRKAIHVSSQALPGWPAALQLFQDFSRGELGVEEKLNGVLCDLQRTAGRTWTFGLETFQQIQFMGCQVDAVHCSSLLRVCASTSGWSEALGLLSCAERRGVQMDGVAWNAMMSATKVAEDIPESPALGHWATAVSMMSCMRWQTLEADVVTFNTLLSANTGRWQGILGLLVDMAQTRLPLQDVAALTVVDACAQAGQLALGWRVMTTLLKDVPPVVRLWSMANLAVADPHETLRVLMEACGQLRHMEGSMSPGEVCKLWWAASILGVQSKQLSELLVSQALRPGFLSRCQLDELVAVAMAATAGATRRFFEDLQLELQRRFRATGHRAEDAGKIRKALQDFLGILWALNFARELSPSSLSVATSEIRRLASRLDDLDDRTAPLPTRGRSFGGPTGESDDGSTLATPRVTLELPELMVLEKPPGWEVYGDTRHQLRSFILDRSARAVGRPIYADLKHAYGFLHRLDIPSSGLILSAKTYASYYNLQLQLVSGGISRDYLVLCHGYVPATRCQVNARLNCLLDTTKASGQGKPSRTFIKPTAYAHFQWRSLTLLLVRIDTGRRHQIRSHFAFLQHATVSDSRYSAAETFASDLQFCRNFIHRFQLSFSENLVTMALPEDLRLCLELMSCKTWESQKTLKLLGSVKFTLW